MKSILTAALLLSLAIAPATQAQDWLESLKNMVGLGEEQATPQLSSANMAAHVSEQLGLSPSQSEGALGAIFQYAQQNLSDQKFSSLQSSLPGVDQLLQAVPDIQAEQSQDVFSGLMDKAAQMNENFKAINDVKKQFAALGLDPEMIAQVVSQAKQYLDTEQGQQAQKLLIEGLNNLVGDYR